MIHATVSNDSTDHNSPDSSCPESSCSAHNRIETDGRSFNVDEGKVTECIKFLHDYSNQPNANHIEAPCDQMLNKDIGSVSAASQEQVSQELNCGECCEAAAIYFCIQCDVAICDICNDKIHSLRVLRGHERVHISEKPAPSVICELHKKETIKLFCTDVECRQPVCVLCAFGSHQKHNCRVIEDVVATEKVILGSQVGNFGLLVKDLEERLQMLREAKNQLLSNHIVSVSKLKDDFEDARLILTQRETELQLELRDHMIIRDAEISKLLIETEEQLNLSTLALQNARGILGEVDLDFLAVVDTEKCSLKNANESLHKATVNFAAVPSSELEYKGGTKPDRNKATGPIVSLLLGPLCTVTLKCILEKPFLGEHLIVTDTVVLDLPINAAGIAVEPLKYDMVTVKSGGVLTVRAWEGLMKKGGVLALIVSGRLLIEEGGSIDVSGKGISEEFAAFCYIPKTAMGGEYKGLLYGGGGGGFGSAGISGCFHRKGDFFYPREENGGHGFGDGEICEGDLLRHRLLGAPGGNTGQPHAPCTGGAGGGSILIVTNSFCNNGIISSNGADGENSKVVVIENSSAGGGGSGGSIKIIARDIETLGKISATGEKDGRTVDGHFSGGAGGHGRICIESSTILTLTDKASVSPIPVVVTPQK